MICEVIWGRVFSMVDFHLVSALRDGLPQYYKGDLPTACRFSPKNHRMCLCHMKMVDYDENLKPNWKRKPHE